jgi:protein gp37
MQKTSIEWAQYSSNPVYAVDVETGKRGWYCSKVSPGCAHCYAERINLRRGTRLEYNQENIGRIRFVLNQEELDAWVRLKEPSRIFIEDMSDLFHENVPFDYLDKVFDVMRRAHQHTYQILTKRPHRMLEFSQRYGRIPNHIWMGTSVESWPFKNHIDVLRQVPAKIRFVSFEPLIDSLRPPLVLSGIAWAIVGGESGPNFRPVNVEWIREIRDECLRQGVPFFLKQIGGLRPKSGGRELDGRTWNDYPNLNLQTLLDNHPTLH